MRGVDLEVRTGEILALLGPNGAGKTTTVEILEGFRQATAGEVRVLGEDPGAGIARCAIASASCCRSRSRSSTSRSASASSSTRATTRRRAPSTTRSRWPGSASRRTSRRRQLSGGQRRRLDVALALIGDPDLIFLDEPTTGFDPAARRAAWEVISGLRALGTTILLTTHYMEEAERLADRIAVMRDGVIVADRDAGDARRAQPRDRRRSPSRCPTASSSTSWRPARRSTTSTASS